MEKILLKQYTDNHNDKPRDMFLEALQLLGLSTEFQQCSDQGHKFVTDILILLQVLLVIIMLFFRQHKNSRSQEAFIYVNPVFLFQ